jgi:GH25 family lysozyme M1 (1,4-beta-N-acetylmuramidase)
MTIFVDRSNVNGTDDYARAPVTHLYLKATEGTTFTDGTYAVRRNQAQKAGAKVGAYHFARHGDPRAEADFFLSRIVAPKPGELRPCLDLEDGQNAQWAEQFVLRVKQKLGYWPVVYGSTSFIAPMRSGSTILRSCPWWRAEYGPNDGARHALTGGDMGAAAHQYTSVATVPGITGHTDQSALIDEKQLIVPGTPVDFKKWGVYHDGTHVRNFRRYHRALIWAARHRPKEGHQIGIRHRKADQ